MFNIISRKTLLDYAAAYPSASNALFEWYHELANSDFRNFNELKSIYPSASIIKDNRVVFNIMGNRYRLVVRVIFDFKTIQIKWFGSHAEYDVLDVSKIAFNKK